MLDSEKKKTESKQKKDELIIDLIVSLTILEKNIVMYPSGHSAISRASERLFHLMDDLFQGSPMLTLTAVKNRIFVDDMLLETTNARVQDFALFLSQRGVAMISFRKGIHAQELERFYRLFMEVPPKSYIHHHPDIQEKIGQLSDIRIKEIDLSGIQFIEYGNASEPREDRVPVGGTGPGGMTDASAKAQLFSLAKGPDRTQSELQLKHQILNTTLESLNSAPDEETLETMLATIPGDMVVAALQQAKETNGEISPSLINLLGALSRKWKPTLSPSPSADPQMDITLNQIQTLFKRELYEVYVTDEYDEDLHRVSMGEDHPSGEGTNDFSMNSHLGALRDENIDKTLARALLRLTAVTLDDGIYGDFSNNIAQLVQGLLESGDCQLLADIYSRFIRDAQGKEDQQTRDAASEVVNAFWMKPFVKTLEATYDSGSTSRRKELESLIFSMGPGNLPWLLRIYVKHCDSSGHLEIGDFICRFGPSATEEALARLSGEDVSQTLALMKLIQKCGNHYSPVQLRVLLESEQEAVRFEALRMLLISKDHSALAAVRRLLHSKDEALFLQGIRMVQEYEIQEVSQDLGQLIKTRYISETALLRNKRIISALEHFGSPQVLPLFQSIAQAKFTWSPAYLKQTQETLYRSLSGYPVEAIQELLHQGIKSNNKAIRNLCKKMVLMK